MDIYFIVGQIGIFLEVCGAGYIVYSAYRSKSEISKIEKPESFGGVGETAIKVHALVKSQFANEAKGFSVLFVGLAMQFLGGFGA